jgi:hypothetical protein
MIAKWVDGRVTICNANGFVCLQEPESVALERLKARGVSPRAAELVLSRTVSPAEWRATFISASAATTLAVQESLVRAAETSDVEELRSKFDELAATLNRMREQAAENARLSERQGLEEFMQSEAARIITLSMKALHPNNENAVRRATWKTLWESPEGQRLQELRNAS